MVLDAGEDNDTINISGKAKIKESIIGAGAGADDKINISGEAVIDTAALKLGSDSYGGGKATDKTTLNVTEDAVLNNAYIDASQSLGKQVMNFHQNKEAKVSKIDGSNNKDIIDIKGDFTITDALPDGKIYGNGGDDELNIHNGATAKIKADMGDGNDTLTVDNATLKDSVVEMGNGNDTVNINAGATIDNVSIKTGGGVGTVNINAGATVNKVDIITGAENDTVNIGSDITAPATTPSATQSNIITGAGSDTVNIASGVTLTRTVIDMGAGEDTIELKGNSDTDRITFKGSALYTDDAGYTANEVDHVTITNTTFMKSDDGKLSGVLTGGGNDEITVKEGTVFQDFSYISAGDGKDTINLEDGAKFDQASVRADAGNDIINVNGAEFKGENAGNPNAGIHGGDGNDEIFVNAGGFNNAVINGDAGDDLISIKQGVNLNNTTIDGGAGYDTLKIADDSLDFSKVKNIEKLDLTEGNHNINLSAKDVLDMTDDNNKLRIGGDSNDNLDLASKGWVSSGTTTTDENGINYNVYTNTEGGKTVTLEVQDQVHVF